MPRMQEAHATLLQLLKSAPTASIDSSWVAHRSFRCLWPFLYTCLAAIEIAAQLRKPCLLGKPVATAAIIVPCISARQWSYPAWSRMNPMMWVRVTAWQTCRTPPAASRFMETTRCFHLEASSGVTYWKSGASWLSTGEWRNCNWKPFVAPAPRRPLSLFT